ncbi:MAG: RHS repeat-associated core domain-containing protein, partial [bacterium]|nr:RHS repeat-associated core domain-containing protein [bacterium]
ALTAALGGSHLTAVSALTRAVREGQTLTRVDAGNVDAALAAANLGEDAEDSILAGVGSGRIAWIHQSQLLHQTWDASGYVLEDPATGAGGYFVTYERLLTGLDADITFHSPQDLGVVTEPIDVAATIESEHEIVGWTLSTRPANGGEAVVLAAGSGTVTAETLAQFDPTLLLNGLYDLVLTARDALGQAASEKISVVVEGQMKIGHFTLSFVDLAVPVSGLDIEIVRTYDSRDKRQGDFGVGWSLDIRQGSYVNNRPPGDGWQFQTNFVACDTALESKSHLTVVRLSDQEVYRFALRLYSGAPSTGGGCRASARFDFVDGPQPGTTLEILGNDQVFYENGSDRVIDVDTLETYEPEDVRLTTRDGRIFELDLNDGVTLVEDLNGNQLSITPAGITHSSGKGIAFDHDDEGRITGITDPMDRSMSYGYDAAGDLASFTDRAGATTHFTYDSDHRLQDIEDPRGVKPIRNEYDDEGRLVRHIDAFGKAIELGHDLENRREVITNRLGASRILEYDARGNRVRETDELGATTIRTFDSLDNLLSETHPLGRQSIYTYTAEKELATLTDPLGHVTSYTYDNRGRLLTVTDPRGGVTANVYDARGNLVQTINSLGGVTSLSYDAAGNLLTVIDPVGQFTSFGYDAFGQQTKVIDGLGHETVSTYDGVGNRVTENRSRTLADGSAETLITSFVYDELDRVTIIVAADGNSTSTTYDLLGRVTSRTDALGRVTVMTYDLMGRLVTTSYPDGTARNYSYDAEGRRLAETDRAGRPTYFAYDAAGRLLTTTYPDGAINSMVYDSAGQRISTTDARGNTTGYAYDAAGRRTVVINALGNTTTSVYDANGNRISVTDPRGKTTSFAYDGLDRRVRTDFPDGTDVHVGYDAFGRRVSETDQAGLMTQFTFDTLGQLTSVTDAGGRVTAYTYDEIGNRLTQTDAKGNTTRFEYDRMSRHVARILPDGARESMSYYPDGTIASQADFAGQARTFEYDLGQRLVRRVYPNGSEVLSTYTATGQRATATDSRGLTTYAYDDRDRLVEKQDPTGHRLTYAYDSEGNVTSLTATVGASSYTTAYSYDALNRLEKIIDPQGAVSTHTYDAAGNRISFGHANALTTTYSYDDLNRLTLLETRDTALDAVQTYAFTLTSTGHRAQIAEANGTVRFYAYDDLYRLVQDRVADSGGLGYLRTYTYDSVGNRLLQSVDEGSGPSALSSTYDQRDRLLTVGATGYNWDANGNLIARDGDVLAWDFDQRLTSVTGADGTIVETAYDVDGNRVQTRVSPPGEPPVTVDYLVDTRGFLGHVVAEVLVGVVQTLYVRSNDELISLFRPGSGEARHFHADGLGSIRLLTDAAGTVRDRYEYTAFGELLTHTGSDDQPYRFAGEPYSPNARFYYNRARWLDPENGRFLSVDPFSGRIFDPSSLHTYLYADADPVGVLDPTGLVSVAQVLTVSAFAVNLATSLYGIASGVHALSEGRTVRGITEISLGFLGLGIFGTSLRVLRFMYSSANLAARARYVTLVDDIRRVIPALKRMQFSKMKIARTLVDMRNLEKLRSRAEMIRGAGISGRVLVKILEVRNLIKYKNKLGPSVEWFLAREKTLDAIIESAYRTSGSINSFFGVS